MKFFHVDLGRPGFTLPMGWGPLIKSLWDPVVFHLLKVSKLLQSAFFDGVREHWLFCQGTHIFICDML